MTKRSPALKRGPYFGKINSTYLFEIEGIKDRGDWREVKGLSHIRIQTERESQFFSEFDLKLVA